MAVYVSRPTPQIQLYRYYHLITQAMMNFMTVTIIRKVTQKKGQARKLIP